MTTKTYRVRIWNGWQDDYSDEPDETVTVEEGERLMWQDDPYYDSGKVAFDIHPDDIPATLYIYTNDSVRAPPTTGNLRSEWGRAVERGLTFADPEEYTKYPPFGCRIYGRVLLTVEEGAER